MSIILIDFLIIVYYKSFYLPLNYFEKVHDQHQGETIVAVSHNLTIITLLCKITGVGLKGFRDFSIQATSKNVIVSENGDIRVDVINDVSHLSPMESVPDFEAKR